MKLLKELELYRLEHGITQEKLAEMLGVPYLTVNRWLTGKTKPSKLYAYRIEKLLKGRKK